MVSAQNKSSDKEQLLLVKPFFMLDFSFFLLYFLFLQNSASPQKCSTLCKAVFLFCLFCGHLFLFPCCFAEVDVWQYCVQFLKLHLIMKTLLFALILSRYWQIGVFALVIEASCGPGRV